VVRVDGIDTETGKHRPRQLGTYSSQRAARQAVAELLERGAVESAVRAKKGTVGELVEAWAASKVDVTAKSRLQYEWATGHIRKGLGGIPLDQLTGEDVARWIDEMAASGLFARSSVQLFRMLLRAALDEAVAEGRLRRSPAARVGMPRHVAKPELVREVPAWTEDDVRRFLAASKDHRWYGPLRLNVLNGLRPQRAPRAEVGRRRPQGRHGAHRARSDRGARPPDVDRGQERPIPPHDPDRSEDHPTARRPPPPPARGAPGRRQQVGRQRPRRGEQDRHGRVTGQLRPDPRAIGGPGPASHD
jgi:hypothetical protein